MGHRPNQGYHTTIGRIYGTMGRTNWQHLRRQRIARNNTSLSGKQYPNYVSNFTTVEFNVTDGEEHFVEVAFRKDSGVNSNYDAGFINIKYSDISNKTFEVKENHSYADTGNIIHVLSNPKYNGGVHINNVGGSYIHGLPSGVTGVNNIPVYKYNSYDLELDRISGEYSSKNGTNANYLLTYYEYNMI